MKNYCIKFYKQTNLLAMNDRNELSDSTIQVMETITDWPLATLHGITIQQWFR